MSNYRIIVSDEYLEHHGILGQKWGKLNGPPYPLDRSISTGSRLKTTTTKKKKSALNTDVKDLVNNYKINKIKKKQQDEARKLKVEKAKTKLAETQQKVQDEQKKNSPQEEPQPKIQPQNNQQNQQQYNQPNQQPRKITPAEKFGTIDAENIRSILKSNANHLSNEELQYLTTRLTSLNNVRSLTTDPTALDRLNKARTIADTIVNSANSAERIYDLGKKVYTRLSGKPRYETKSYEYLLKNFDNLSTNELNDAFARLEKLSKVKSNAMT